jgi:hypothetical protein
MIMCYIVQAVGRVYRVLSLEPHVFPVCPGREVEAPQSSY